MIKQALQMQALETDIKDVLSSQCDRTYADINEVYNHLIYLKSMFKDSMTEVCELIREVEDEMYGQMPKQPLTLVK